MAAENAGHDDDGDCQLAKRKNDVWLKDSDGWVCVPMLGCTLNQADSLFVVYVQGGAPFDRTRCWAVCGDQAANSSSRRGVLKVDARELGQHIVRYVFHPNFKGIRVILRYA